MSDHDKNFEIPKNIDRYLAALSKIYSQEGHKEQQQIIVNSQVRIQEEWSYDNWNGGIYGHAVYFITPESIFPKSIQQREEFQEQIKKDLNSVKNSKNEFIDAVFIDIDVPDGHDWRKGSGLLLDQKYVVSPDIERRIWGDEGFRVFLSHKSEVKKDTAELKENLKILGVSAFVAHEDIEPTITWQEEIENALFSMDAFVALMTDQFHDSSWTDQEVGVAFGRRVPIIAIKLGKDPYGFIGKFQALSCSWKTAPHEIVKILVKYNKMLDSYINAVKNCQSFNDAKTLSEILPNINKLSSEQISNLVSAFNENQQLKNSYVFNGKKSSLIVNSLPHNLTRLTGQKYILTKSDNIEVEK